jgi:hypothetical protein
MSFRFLRAFALAVLAVLMLPMAAAAQHGAGVGRVLERARQASGGGSAWNALRGYHEVGVENGKPYARWVDGLRWGERIEVGANKDKVTQGYNGFGVWWLPLSTPRPPGSGSDQEILARARSDAFFAAYGYYFTGRFDLRSTYLGARPSGGKSYEVVRIQPVGGEPRELWFDRGTGLLGRIVEGRTAAPRTIELSDYREVGRLKLPFTTKIYGGGLAQPLERRLERIELLAPDRALFSLPRPPGEVLPPPPPPPKKKRSR